MDGCYHSPVYSVPWMAPWKLASLLLMECHCRFVLPVTPVYHRQLPSTVVDGVNKPEMATKMTSRRCVVVFIHYRAPPDSLMLHRHFW